MTRGDDVLAGVSLLAVINETVQRRTMVDALMVQGAHVLEAAQATTGMALAQDGVDLIVVDPDRPDVDGMEMRSDS